MKNTPATTAQSHATASDVVINNAIDGLVLSRAILSALPAGVRIPEFDLASLTPGILHIGPGNFALAHLLSYLQDVNAFDPTWGVVAVSTQTSGMVTALRKQDNLYLLVERENAKRTATVMGSIVDTLFAPDCPDKVVEYIADPRIRIVTMTISNKAYCLASGGLDMTNADVVHDMGLPATPKTIYGYIAKGLIERRKAGHALTIMSLDNVEKNSRSLQIAMLQFLTQIDPELAAWTEANVDFLVTLVDRITPKVTDKFRHETREQLGITSSVIIGTESYRELVVEKGRFAMPAWEKVGVKVVEASASGSHWMRKFFCLNAGHQVPGIAGQRKGVTFVYEAMGHSAIARLLEQFHVELTSSIIPGDAVELAAYCAKIRSRFGDEAMDDTVDRVVARTTSKVSERLLAAVELGLQADGKVMKAPTFVAAIWLHNLGGENEFGEHIAIDDVDAAKLQDLHRDVISWVHAHADDADCSVACSDAVKGFLVRISEAIRDPRFARLAQVEAFVQLLGWSLVAIHQQGIEKAIESLLAR